MPQDGLQAAAAASVAAGQPVVGEVAAGLMAAVARQSLPDRALLERVAVDVIQDELTQEMGACLDAGQAWRWVACWQQRVSSWQGLPVSRSVLTGQTFCKCGGPAQNWMITQGRQQNVTPLYGAGDQQNILLRTSVGVQTQHAPHEQEAEGSDAATQHEEQPVADAAPSPACPRADGQVQSNCLRDHQIVVMPACFAWAAAPCTHITWVPAVTACPSVQQDQSQGTADFVLLGVLSGDSPALQVAPVHVGARADTPARPHSSDMDCVDDALLELVLHALAEASLESIRGQQLHQAQLLATPAAVGAQADSGAVLAPGGSNTAHADAGSAHGAVSTAPEQADSGAVPAPGGSDAAHADAGAARGAVSTAPKQAEQLGQRAAALAATSLPSSLPAATDQHTKRPDNAAVAARAAISPMPSQQLEGEESM